jgi:small subunit ribosomal protein S4
MSRYRNSRIRVIRRLGQLPGFTKKITTRKKPPGEHDPKPSSSSEYAIRLDEKQKLRYNYGVSERQLYNLIKKTRRMSGSTGLLLLQFLEMRLDNIVYRLGFSSTIPESRQIINHNHIFVNNTLVGIPSFQCKKGDVITIKNKSKTFIKNNLISTLVPKFLELDKNNLKGTVKSIIERDQIDLNINELLIVEYYSRK